MITLSQIPAFSGFMKKRQFAKIHLRKVKNVSKYDKKQTQCYGQNKLIENIYPSISRSVLMKYTFRMIWIMFYPIKVWFGFVARL